MEIIYLGDHVSEALNKEKSINTAGNKWQKNLIGNLKKKSNVEVFSYFRPPLFPKIKKILVPTKKQSLANNKESILIPFLNLPLIREISIFFTTLYILNKKIKSNSKIKILQYNLYSPVALAVLILQRKYKFEYIPIILDIVLEDSYKVNIIKKMYIKCGLYIQKKIMKKITKVIVINKCIIDDYFKEVKYLLLEGGISFEDIFPYEEKKSYKDINIVFTGTLDYVNGIDFLINSFKKIKNKKLKLTIYGQGELLNFVKKSLKEDNRISYQGYLPNKEILKIQKEADFLIIPRKKSNPILRYTFPSKLFEYMISGTPVICTNLPGLEKEYKSKILVVDTEDEEVFSREIEKILKIDSKNLNLLTKQAFEFIKGKKNWEFQIEKLLHFLK
ncbi:MAG: glycosyltransferase [Fusobacteriaceae bacterium]